MTTTKKYAKLQYPPAKINSDLYALVSALRLERKRQKITITRMTELTKIGRSTLSQLENGKHTNPSYLTLHRYVQALGKRLIFTIGD